MTEQNETPDASFEDIAEAQGWNADSIATLLMAFIDDHADEAQLIAFAQARANEENEPYFETALSKTRAPEEIFGPLDLDVLEQAKAVERGEAPSGSVVMKLTGKNSLHTPGHACTYSGDACKEPAVAWWHSPFGSVPIYGCAEHLAKMQSLTFNANVEVTRLV